MRRMETAEVLMGRLPTGSDLLEGITALCRENRVLAGKITIIGALRKAKLGWYDEDAREYHTFEVPETTEILSCVGNVSVLDGRPFPHVHAVLGLRDEKVLGGHVFQGCEVFVAEYVLEVFAWGEGLERVEDPTTGLKLWPADKASGE